MWLYSVKVAPHCGLMHFRYEYFFWAMPTFFLAECSNLVGAPQLGQITEIALSS